MPENSLNPSPSLFRRLERSALGVLLLTSVHHVYGAVIYDTPWRLHAVVVSAGAAAVIVASLYVAQKRAGFSAKAAFWLFAAVTFTIPVGLIGLYEGLYNHVVKNALYFGGASDAILSRLFPPPMYELPNDFFFELSGMAQAVAGIVSAIYLVRAVRQQWHTTDRDAEGDPLSRSSREETA